MTDETVQLPNGDIGYVKNIYLAYLEELNEVHFVPADEIQAAIALDNPVSLKIAIAKESVLLVMRWGKHIVAYWGKKKCEKIISKYKNHYAKKGIDFSFSSNSGQKFEFVCAFPPEKLKSNPEEDIMNMGILLSLQVEELYTKLLKLINRR